MSWHNESYRHSLSARGVSTKRYLANKYMKFRDSPKSVDGNEDSYGTLTEEARHSRNKPLTHADAFRKFDIEVEEMAPEDFLEITRMAMEVRNRHDMPQSEFERPVRERLLPGSAESMDFIKEGLLSGDDVVPLPYYEVTADGSLIDTQEGRRRAIVAESLGMKKIRVVRATRRTEDQKEREAFSNHYKERGLSVPWDAYVDYTRDSE